MSEIFNIIGVKPFEKFTIKNTEGVYYFNENLFCFKVGGSSFLLTQDLEWIIGNIEPLPKSFHLLEEERKILQALDTLGFKYVARDCNKTIYAFDCNSLKDIEKSHHYWTFNFINTQNRMMQISRNKNELFSFMKFEDEKPYEIKEMLKWQ
jgi:hypothetical protein